MVISNRIHERQNDIYLYPYTLNRTHFYQAGMGRTAWVSNKQITCEVTIWRGEEWSLHGVAVYCANKEHQMLWSNTFFHPHHRSPFPHSIRYTMSFEFVLALRETSLPEIHLVELLGPNELSRVRNGWSVYIAPSDIVSHWTCEYMPGKSKGKGVEQLTLHELREERKKEKLL